MEPIITEGLALSLSLSLSICIYQIHIFIYIYLSIHAYICMNICSFILFCMNLTRIIYTLIFYVWDQGQNNRRHISLKCLQFFCNCQVHRIHVVVQFNSVQSLSRVLTLCSLMNHSTPGVPVHHQLKKSTQTMGDEYKGPVVWAFFSTALLIP